MLSVLVALALAAPVSAAPAAPPDEIATVTTATAEPRVEGATTPLRIRVATTSHRPVADVPVVLQRRVGGTWRRLAGVRTGAQGRASAPMVLARRAADNVVRVRYAGGDPVPGAGGGPEPTGETYGASTSGPVSVGLLRRSSRITLEGPGSVRDGDTVALRIVRRTGAGGPVPGWVGLQRRTPSGWRGVLRVQLGDQGRGAAVVRPRRTTRYRVASPPQDWVQGATSGGHVVRNLPPGSVVRLPVGAPRPRIGLPGQRLVRRAGASPVVTRIPGGVWQSMTGRSWHRGCPVGRAGLRLLRVTYWGYDGYRHRGEMVVGAWAVQRAAGALGEMYRRGFPIRRMYRVDRFGWSNRLQGANDYRSMASGNSSGFNCRSVVGRPGIRSPHAYGGAIDINTWENPYRSRAGWVPNRYWGSRSHERVAWRSPSHPVVGIWARHGFRWTFGVDDSQHFDAVRSNGRVIAPRGCTVYCH